MLSLPHSKEFLQAELPLSSCLLPLVLLFGTTGSISLGFPLQILTGSNEVSPQNPTPPCSWTAAWIPQAQTDRPPVHHLVNPSQLLELNCSAPAALSSTHSPQSPRSKCSPPAAISFGGQLWSPSPLLKLCVPFWQTHVMPLAYYTTCAIHFFTSFFYILRWLQEQIKNYFLLRDFPYYFTIALVLFLLLTRVLTEISHSQTMPLCSYSLLENSFWFLSPPSLRQTPTPHSAVPINNCWMVQSPIFKYASIHRGTLLQWRWGFFVSSLPQNNLVVGYFLIASRSTVVLSMFRKIYCSQIHYLQMTVHEESTGDFGGTLQSVNFRVEQSWDL